ncbi:MAG: riboflavin synthase [Candidatus Omnitrophica bacterium]|nr:riboflavin synthase [Candidatus Omnitrophota bacterium]
MFSGIIEEVGRIRRIISSGGVSVCDITGDKVFEDLKEGDSISVNGVCLTVEKTKDNVFTVSLSRQTLKETNFSDARAGDYVNLERAMRLGERIGGHMLTGHIDFKTPLQYLHREKDSAILRFYIPEKFQKYVVCRGSIGIDGISFTVAEVNGREIKIFVIPYTMEHTNIKHRRPGDIVNIELDIMAKYVENMNKNP